VHNSDDEAPEPEHATTTPGPLIRHVDEPSRDFENRVLKLARIDEAEQAKLEAIFSYNVMNITDPPLEFKNPYNPRPVVKSRVRIMRNALLKEGFRVFSNENRIMIVIDPSDVDPQCITLDPTADPVPFALSSKHNLSSLSIIGGQHRREAVLLIKSEYAEKMSRLRAKIQEKLEVLKDFEEQPPDSEDGILKKNLLEKDIEDLRRELEGHEDSMDLIGPWGVTLLDASE
jgi:hypothetical protein